MDLSATHTILANFHPDQEAPGAYLAGLFEGTSVSEVFGAVESILRADNMDEFWAVMGALQFLCSRPDHIPAAAAMDFTAQAHLDGRISKVFSSLCGPTCFQTDHGAEKLSSIMQSWPRLAGLVSPEMLMKLAPVLPEGYPLLVPAYFLGVVRRLAGDDHGYLGQLMASKLFLTRLSAYQIIIQGSLADAESLSLLSRRPDPDPLLEPFRLWLLDWVSVQTLVREMGEIDELTHDATLVTRFSVHLDPSSILTDWFARSDKTLGMETFVRTRIESL